MLKKINKILLTIVVFFCTIIIVNCSDKVDENQRNTAIDRTRQKESLEKANRYLLLQEKENIKDYIARHNIDAVETGTGLRYCIIKQGAGDKIKKGDVVSMDYEVRFLTGDLVYSSKEDGPKVFVVGRGGVESGLEEAMLHFHKGDWAEIIIPSHLAYGLLGDGNRIPPKTAVVYSVHIIDNQLNN